MSEHLTTETETETPYAGLSKQAMGGFMKWLKSEIGSIISLTKSNRELAKGIPLEVQEILDTMKQNVKEIGDTKKSIYAKAKTIQLRKDVMIELSKLKYVLKQLKLDPSSHFQIMLVHFTGSLDEAGIPAEEVVRITTLLVEAHNQALESKKPQESYTLYVKV